MRRNGRAHFFLSRFFSDRNTRSRIIGSISRRLKVRESWFCGVSFGKYMYIVLSQLIPAVLKPICAVCLCINKKTVSILNRYTPFWWTLLSFSIEIEISRKGKRHRKKDNFFRSFCSHATGSAFTHSIEIENLCKCAVPFRTMDKCYRTQRSQMNERNKRTFSCEKQKLYGRFFFSSLFADFDTQINYYLIFMQMTSLCHRLNDSRQQQHPSS